MHKPSREDRANALDAFALIDDSPPIVPVDRSTLERYAACPAQARFIDSGRLNDSNPEAASGSAVHDAIGEVIAEYVEMGADIDADMTPGEMADGIMARLREARPDIQQDAIAGARASAWAIAQYLSRIAPVNILRYDGGTGKRSGQLAYDLADIGVRVTSEIDLLHAASSVEQLIEVDWKSGHKILDADDIATSFQFQLHALLVLENYPGVQSVVIRAWNTRVNRLTWRVEWTRKDLAQITARVRSAAELWHRHQHIEPEQCPTWPMAEKCAICPAAIKCPAAGENVTLLAWNPDEFVDNLVATEAKLDAMKKLANLWVDRTGRDLVSATGNAYGIHRPPGKPKRPKKCVYAISTPGKESEDTSDADD